MMALRDIMIWIIQAVLFGIGIGFAGLMAHLAGPLLAAAFAIDELIPTAIVFFAVAAGLRWIGKRILAAEWMGNPLYLHSTRGLPHTHACHFTVSPRHRRTSCTMV